jgi:peroxin-5
LVNFCFHQGRNWNAEYSAFQQSNPGYTQNEKDMFEQAFEQAKQNTQQVNWEQEFAAQESWATEFQEEQKEEQAKETFVDNGDLARTAAMLLDSVDAEANPKFKNSQFMDLMRKLRDSEVTIEGDKMVETKGKSWASEFEGSAQTKDWTSEFVQNAGNATSGNMWSNEFAQKAERGWTEDWSADFNNQASTSEAQMHELFGKGSEMDDWVQQYNKNIAHLKTAQDREWDDMQKDWERFKPEQGLGYRATNPNYDTYNFTVNNPYLMNPEAIEGTSHNTLSDAILALEAKAQLQTNDATAWQQLGMRQQENERDDAAISALRQAVKMNPSSLESWLALAVSYTNENCRADAYDALEEWIAHNDQYNQLLNVTKGKMTVSDRHAYITDLFIQAARNSPGAEMDADVQVGLGVLFNMSEEYEKAIDCFKSALGSRPQVRDIY